MMEVSERGRRGEGWWKRGSYNMRSRGTGVAFVQILTPKTRRNGVGQTRTAHELIVKIQRRQGVGAESVCVLPKNIGRISARDKEISEMVNV